MTVLRFAALLAFAACSSISTLDYASRNGMQVDEVDGDGFKHLAIYRASPQTGARLHVYLEGDGIPWVGNRSSRDPTPRNTLALRLAAADQNDVLYLGRPCYFGMSGRAECHPKYWTSHRYGESVLQSMAAAIETAREPKHEQVLLVGHSGGGTLAALLESRVAGVAGVISIAANLDVEQWARFHHYDPLLGSLNPIVERKDAEIPHLQLVGGRDDNVPTDLSIRYAQAKPNVELVVIDDYDHVCCWEEEWPTILRNFTESLGD
jgi:pimeloyl-ACP methyl ester carboxylesterase